MTTRAAAPPRLETPGVSLHVFDLGGLVGERAAFEVEAPPEERARADGYRAEAHRTRFVLRRGALRRLLAAKSGAPPREVRFLAGYGGKPRLADAGPRFSASSSGDLFVVAVSAAQEVGVDVERVVARPGLDDVARLFFPPVVRARLEALDGAARLAAFYRVWTLEEAVGKLDGRGIAEGTPLADVPFDALTRDGRWPLPAPPASGPRSVETLALGVGAVLSLATAPAGRDRAVHGLSVRS